MATGDETDPELMTSGEKRFSYDKVIRKKNRILLTDKTSRPNNGNGGIGTHRPGHNLDKIPEHALSKVKQGGEMNGSKSASHKTIKLNEEELAFLIDYRRLEDLEREKGIKFFECIGDPPATDKFVNSIETKRDNFMLNTDNKMRSKDTNRFATEINNDKVCVPTKNQITS